ncbi:UNVERIFIED_CONTAM: Ribonuclease HI, partial [Sesamum latifolium]
MTKECQQAFEDLKTYLAKLPLLVKPVPGDTLYLYVSSIPQVVSSVLVREEEGVRTNTPLKQVLSKPETSGRLIKWAIKLSEYDISYLPRTTIKAQALGSGAGIVLTTPQGDDIEFAVKFEFKASNNEAEYEALVLGMRMAQDAGGPHFLAYSDSQLIVKQVNGEYEAKEESMVQYLQQIEEFKTKFKSFQLQQIPREENVKADSLSKLASALEDCKTRRITVQHLPQPRIPLEVQPIAANINDWRTPIIRWIDE